MFRADAADTFSTMTGATAAGVVFSYTTPGNTILVGREINEFTRGKAEVDACSGRITFDDSNEGTTSLTFPGVPNDSPERLFGPPNANTRKQFLPGRLNRPGFVPTESIRDPMLPLKVVQWGIAAPVMQQATRPSSKGFPPGSTASKANSKLEIRDMSLLAVPNLVGNIAVGGGTESVFDLAATTLTAAQLVGATFTDDGTGISCIIEEFTNPQVTCGHTLPATPIAGYVVSNIKTLFPVPTVEVLTPAGPSEETTSGVPYATAVMDPISNTLTVTKPGVLDTVYEAGVLACPGACADVATKTFTPRADPLTGPSLQCASDTTTTGNPTPNFANPTVVGMTVDAINIATFPETSDLVNDPINTSPSAAATADNTQCQISQGIGFNKFYGRDQTEDTSTVTPSFQDFVIEGADRVKREGWDVGCQPVERGSEQVPGQDPTARGVFVSRLKPVGATALTCAGTTADPCTFASITSEQTTAGYAATEDVVGQKYDSVCKRAQEGVVVSCTAPPTVNAANVLGNGVRQYCTCSRTGKFFKTGQFPLCKDWNINGFPGSGNRDDDKCDKKDPAEIARMVMDERRIRRNEMEGAHDGADENEVETDDDYSNRSF
jgi:hypothetical protein